MKKLIVTACMALFLFGCNSTSETGNVYLKNESKETLNTKIKEGVTTQNQIREMFGDPDNVYFDNGLETWAYYHSKIDSDNKNIIPFVGSFISSDMNMNEKKLMILFNKNNIVKKYSFSSSMSKSKYNQIN